MTFSGRKIGKQYSSLFSRSRLVTKAQLKDRTAKRAEAAARYEAAVARWAADTV